MTIDYTSMFANDDHRKPANDIQSPTTFIQAEKAAFQHELAAGSFAYKNGPDFKLFGSEATKGSWTDRHPPTTGSIDNILSGSYLKSMTGLRPEPLPEKFAERSDDTPDNGIVR